MTHHQRIRVHLDAKPLYRVSDSVQKIEGIVVIQENHRPVPAAVHDMVPCAPVVFSDRSHHEQRISCKMSFI